MPQLHYTQFIPAAPAEVWEFFATPRNLDALTPPEVRFQILGPVPARMYAGQLIAYRISPGFGLWLRWLTEIRHVREGAYFVDEQRAGPYKFWYHEHHFATAPGGVQMTDCITYEIGWGPAGWLADRWWVRGQLERIFAYRRRRVEELFPRGLIHFAFTGPLACVGPMPFLSDSIAALATPAGTAAIAVVRASGPQVAALVGEIFKATPPPRSAVRADYKDARGRLVDDVLFTFFAAPNSFTGEDTVEISCHGNPFIAQKILEDLFSRGCRPAEAGEFSKRAFLHGRMDLSQAEAVMDLIHARSERALAAANQQLRGSLGRQMELLISQLVNILARIEAYIDFPEEDLPTEDRQAVLNDLERLQTATGRLLATSHYGAMLRDGIKTVILGEPNAGKSSLLNRLVGRDRALVSAEPGTTRDYLEERILVGPHALRLIDTAGLNETPSSLEKRGIEKTIEQAAEADLFLWVIDATRPLPALPSSVAARLSSANTIAVFNKIDLPAACADSVPKNFSVVKVSALKGTGFDSFHVEIAKLADSFQAGCGDELIAINARHAHALEQANRCLESAGQKLGAGIATELVASDLRESLEAFGQISGKIDHEKVLDQLFASFCIGK